MMIHENDKVEIRTYVGNPRGVVKEIYMFDPKDPILLVQLETEDIIKCHASDTIIIREEPKPDTITLTREEFQKIIDVSMKESSALSNDLFTITAIQLAGTLITRNVEKKLFGDNE